MTSGADDDPLESPSETARAWLATRRWHPMTWLVVIAGVIHLVGDLVLSISDIGRQLGGALPNKPWAEVLAGIAHMVGLSLSYFGTAATVEFLFRIWDELRLRRESARRP
jgi:hypothetical protein